MSIYVSNLSYEVTEEQIGTVFKDYGFVKRVQIPSDRETDRSRGFAFVDMETSAEEVAAIKALDGFEWMGRNLTVKEARPHISGQSKSSTKRQSQRERWGNTQNFSRRRYW
jgi:RNA recognition motif-containing protein